MFKCAFLHALASLAFMSSGACFGMAGAMIAATYGNQGFRDSQYQQKDDCGNCILFCQAISNCCTIMFGALNCSKTQEDTEEELPRINKKIKAFKTNEHPENIAIKIGNEKLKYKLVEISSEYSNWYDLDDVKELEDGINKKIKVKVKIVKAFKTNERPENIVIKIGMKN